MKIHASARFTGSLLPFHNEIEVDMQDSQIQPNLERLINHVLSQFKIKCTDYFKVNWADMYFFEVYYFSDLKEINLFKKEKV